MSDADSGHLLALGKPPLETATGEGVRVAVVDSGAATGHPHVGALAGGVAIAADGSIQGEQESDWVDRIGHGTAVSAVVREKAPAADLQVIKVFHRQLAASAVVLAAAIEAAVERGAQVLNLSLGTPKMERVEILGPVVERALERGVWIVSPERHRDQRWLPGCMPGVVGVELDWTLDRHELRWRQEADSVHCRASGYPRPIPGVPAGRNLKGISFAAANVSGLLALARELSFEGPAPTQSEIDSGGVDGSLGAVLAELSSGG